MALCAAAAAWLFLAVPTHWVSLPDSRAALPAEAATATALAMPPPPPLEPPPPSLVPPPPPSLAPASAPPPAPVEAPRKFFYWGVGLSGAGGYGQRASYDLPLLHASLDARFIAGQRLPDASGGMHHSGLMGISVGILAGALIGSPSGTTWAGPFFMPHAGVDLAYQFLWFRKLDPAVRLQQALGVALGWHLGERFITSYLAGTGAPTTWASSFDFESGPLVEFLYPTYEPVTGALRQRFVRFSRLEAGGDAFYLLSVGSTF
ncbi:MAG: hypothetical protein QM765_19315 [Myxococcales bacterium]